MREKGRRGFAVDAGVSVVGVCFAAAGAGRPPLPTPLMVTVVMMLVSVLLVLLRPVLFVMCCKLYPRQGVEGFL